MRIRTPGLHVLLLCGVIGCRQGKLAGGLTDSTFVAVVTALRQINADENRDSTSRSAARDSVLQGRDLTPGTLERASRELADDPDRAVAAWQRIMRENEGRSVR